jgi:predicted HNH restriction endonuclease
MKKAKWRGHFNGKDTLHTLKRPSPFEVLGAKKDGVRVRFLARKRKPMGVLAYDKLNALVAYMKDAGLPEGKLNRVANEVWEEQGLGTDYQNEAQYWAVACEAITRDAHEGASGRKRKFSEGARFDVTLSRTERRQALRKECLREHGAACIVCGVNFHERYGDIGDGFIHVHHLDPLSQAEGSREATVDDVRPVCPNCHAMLHRRRPCPYTPKDLMAMMKEASHSTA